ncbi:MAG: polysaccharide biosynthesis/export family protein [Phycisphaerae bacterium]
MIWNIANRKSSESLSIAADGVGCPEAVRRSAPGKEIRKRLVRVGLLAGLLVGLGGCQTTSPWDYLNLSNSFLNPAEVGRFDKANPFGRVQPVTWPILDSLAVNDPPPGAWPDSTPPTPADLLPVHKPYVLGAGDVLTISVFELVVPGQESVQTRQINTQGDITLDFIGEIHAAGMTTRQLRREIVHKLIQSGQMAAPGPHQPGPQVNVDLTEARRRVFSIIGAANHPGTYNIMSPDFRLLDALALAGDVPATPGMNYLYVIRRVQKEAALQSAAAAAAPAASGSQTNMLNAIANELQHGKTPVNSSNAAAKNLMNQAMEQTGASVGGRFVYVNGQWVRLGGEPVATAPVHYNFAAATKTAASGYPGEVIIRINLKKLRDGDPRYNIVIHSGDVINVPPLKPSVYFVMGNVGRPGVYSMTGQKLTLEQAIAAAGNFGPLAIPRRCELIRRIGHNQEITIQVNMQAIFSGQEPDIFLKPYDTLNVGTDFFATPLAIIRNGFSASYGFGFTYDRNYYIQPTIIQ